VSAIDIVYTEFTTVNSGILSKLGHAHSKSVCVLLLFIDPSYSNGMYPSYVSGTS
jgi:hypothetical protein